MDDKNLEELDCALIKSILEAPDRTAKDVIEPFLSQFGRQALRDRLVALEKRQLYNYPEPIPECQDIFSQTDKKS